MLLVKLEVGSVIAIGVARGYMHAPSPLLSLVTLDEAHVRKSHFGEGFSRSVWTSCGDSDAEDVDPTP